MPEKDKFMKIRKGIFEHLSKNWLTSDMLVAYMVLLDQCDYPTGVWRGSAFRLAATLGWQRRKAQRVLQMLNEGQYIISKFKNNGKKEYYNILINNYTPPQSKTNYRIRPTKAGLNRGLTCVKNDAATPKTCVKNDVAPASNLTPIQDFNTIKTKNLSRQPDLLLKNNKSTHSQSDIVATGLSAADRQAFFETQRKRREEYNG